jgi:hypothetical protein
MTTTLESSTKDALRRAAAEVGLRVRIDAEPPDPEALHLNVFVGRNDPHRLVSVSRHPTEDEGSEGTTHTFVASDEPIHPHEEERLRAFVAEAARVRRREAAIRPCAGSGMAPAWSYVMHRVARLLIVHAGGGRGLTFRPLEDNEVKPYRSRGRRTPLTTGRALRVTPGEFVGRYGRGVVEARADRLFAHDLEIGVRPDKGPWAVFEDVAAPELVVFGMQAPETLLHACAGMDLARVVDHPAFGDHADVPVERIANQEGSIRIRLPLVLEPAGPTPSGADVSWRTA